MPAVIQAASDKVVSPETERLKLSTGYVMDVPATWDFLFSVDPQIREYCEDRRLWWDCVFWKDDLAYARIEGISMNVVMGMRFAAVTFSPMNNKLSWLLVESPTIRGYFLQVLCKANALAAVYDTEGGSLSLLEDPRCEIDVKSLAWYTQGMTSRARRAQAFDRFVEDILKEIERVRSSR